jgi:diaminopimelate epimerase
MTRFEKWEGLGNDFVVLETPSAALSDEAVRALCDRRRGVGGDGVLLVEGAATPRPRMIVRNADGSRPEMCGNGLRCVAGFLADRSALAPGAALEVSIATDAGDKRCLVTSRAPGLVDVAVAMGRARVGDAWTPAIDGTSFRFRLVDVGNPHAVTFAPHDAEAIDRFGTVLSRLPEEGANIEFCREPDFSAGGPPRIATIVWERGVGRTLACGTGACAVAVAACAAERVAFGAPVLVELPGGALEIVVTQGTFDVTMRGPARRVFSGEIGLP